MHCKRTKLFEPVDIAQGRARTLWRAVPVARMLSERGENGIPISLVNKGTTRCSGEPQQERQVRYCWAKSAALHSRTKGYERNHGHSGHRNVVVEIQTARADALESCATGCASHAVAQAACLFKMGLVGLGCHILDCVS
jgi:hypothetical protein